MIRLNNGGVMIAIPQGKNFKIGETVHIMWDYTTNQPRSVISDVEYNTPDVIEEDTVEEILPPDWAPAHEWAIDF